MKIGIVGSGLLGTSLGLALAGHELWVSDLDKASEGLAADLLGAVRGMGSADLVVVATPVSSITEVVIEVIERNLAPTVTDLGSIKIKPLLEVRSKLGEKANGYVPSHPMSGRELSGPGSARGDIFLGRPWILTPDEQTSLEALAVVEGIAKEAGSYPVRMSAAEHDMAMAGISHLPQLVASAIAAQAGKSPAIELAGQGLRDVTRIAASDPQMWSQILAGNAKSLSPLVEELIASLTKVNQALKSEDIKSIYAFIDEGRKGRSKLPGKHGGKSTNYALVQIVIDDRPGQLGAIFQAAAEHEINVEDVAMEHTPGQETGLVELSVSPERADGFIDFLAARGWRVHRSKA